MPIIVSFRLGGILSPYLANLGNLVPNLHFLVFGLLSLSSGLLNLWLPETLGAELPETIGDLVKLTMRTSAEEKSPSTKYSTLHENDADEMSDSEEDALYQNRIP
jgi:hypothetical protein